MLMGYALFRMWQKCLQKATLWMLAPERHILNFYAFVFHNCVCPASVVVKL